MAGLYVLYCFGLEVQLLKGHCVNCYYYGEICGFGKSKLCAWLFKKGEPENLQRPTSRGPTCCRILWSFCGPFSVEQSFWFKILPGLGWGCWSFWLFFPYGATPLSEVRLPAKPAGKKNLVARQLGCLTWRSKL